MKKAKAPRLLGCHAFTAAYLFAKVMIFFGIQPINR